MLPFWLEAFVNPPLEIMTDRERYIRRVVMNEFEERIMETWNRAKRKGVVADESLVITALTLLGPLFKDCNSFEVLLYVVNPKREILITTNITFVLLHHTAFEMFLNQKNNTKQTRYAHTKCCCAMSSIF